MCPSTCAAGHHSAGRLDFFKRRKHPAVFCKNEQSNRTAECFWPSGQKQTIGFPVYLTIAKSTEGNQYAVPKQGHPEPPIRGPCPHPPTHTRVVPRSQCD